MSCGKDTVFRRRRMLKSGASTGGLRAYAAETARNFNGDPTKAGGQMTRLWWLVTGREVFYMCWGSRVRLNYRN